MVPQVIKTVGYTNFSPFIPIPSPIIAPTAGTLTAISPIVINNFTIIASPMHFFTKRDFSKSQVHSLKRVVRLSILSIVSQFLFQFH